MITFERRDAEVICHIVTDIDGGYVLPFVWYAGSAIKAEAVKHILDHAFAAFKEEMEKAGAERANAHEWMDGYKKGMSEGMRKGKRQERRNATRRARRARK